MCSAPLPVALLRSLLPLSVPMYPLLLPAALGHATFLLFLLRSRRFILRRRTNYLYLSARGIGVINIGTNLWCCGGVEITADL